MLVLSGCCQKLSDIKGGDSPGGAMTDSAFPIFVPDKFKILVRDVPMNLMIILIEEREMRLNLIHQWVRRNADGDLTNQECIQVADWIETKRRGLLRRALSNGDQSQKRLSLYEDCTCEVVSSINRYMENIRRSSF